MTLDVDVIKKKSRSKNKSALILGHRSSTKEGQKGKPLTSRIKNNLKLNLLFVFTSI